MIIATVDMKVHLSSLILQYFYNHDLHHCKKQTEQYVTVA